MHFIPASALLQPIANAMNRVNQFFGKGFIDRIAQMIDVCAQHIVVRQFIAPDQGFQFLA